ncbi:hypothetical protein E3N88_19138 [Mikania micrantha]|uniref:Uncharacterized protein n=1 Tax=Mikania micrantha TaxID=192012 RepID=A0A5N6NMD3_9ASTR|nr:hypothetical protein E3N88_19138 [Mikania micrantha]
MTGNRLSQSKFILRLLKFATSDWSFDDGAFNATAIATKNHLSHATTGTHGLQNIASQYGCAGSKEETEKKEMTSTSKSTLGF